MTAAHSSTPADRPRPGLRERKKIKTREAIRTATYALIEEQGYEATTIEQIADRAEVSPSTVFRYFPAKEDIVLTDEHDPLLLEQLRARPADEPWPQFMRQIMHKAIGLGTGEAREVTRLRCRLLAEVPAVRSRMTESMSETGHVLAEAIGERTGRDPQSLEVRVFAMSLIGGLMEVSQCWARTGFRDDLADLVDRALALYERPPDILIP
ncbi:TetR/AcrR family transcriptional regulator [Streptomyces gossypiisoli]|uniref:TetR/AcrR family transcriptional regulator n=1 Tax=Streptomyces gossypiisoli TaxID=2748864 RepID=UPI0015DB6E57|nr:TetR family transcriptional regulator [Streptomyces gossypiisoli]